jgi:hypothetical protein
LKPLDDTDAATDRGGAGLSNAGKESNKLAFGVDLLLPMIEGGGEKVAKVDDGFNLL